MMKLFILAILLIFVILVIILQLIQDKTNKVEKNRINSITFTLDGSDHLLVKVSDAVSTEVFEPQVGSEIKILIQQGYADLIAMKSDTKPTIKRDLEV